MIERQRPDEPDLDDFPTVLYADFAPVQGDSTGPVKRVVGDTFDFECTAIASALQFTELTIEAVVLDPAGVEHTVEVQSRNPGLDLWGGWFTFDTVGIYTICMRGWPDRVAWYRTRIEDKAARGVSCRDELDGLVALGRQLPEPPVADDHNVLAEARQSLADGAAPVELCRALSDYLAGRVHELPSTVPARSRPWVVQVAPVRALASAWYQFFPRSEIAADAMASHGTFDSAVSGLDRAKAMGFDTIYLPPIHPIGVTNRKGPADTVATGADPGSPWAVGNSSGGHDAVNPDLGGLDAFRRFLDRARELDLTVALDYPLNFSPDHPWVVEHPEWFVHRQDGSLLPAGSVDKYYADILSVDYDGAYRHELLEACYAILEYWIGEGVLTFRVDLPHARSLTFWDTVFRRMRADHPEVVFLAEAFTSPRRQEWMSRLGFTQSLTYFLWRETAQEMGEYLAQLHGPQRDFLRPNLFVNSHDYLPPYLQTGDLPVFQARSALAALGSPAWGMYAGYEMLDHEPREPGSTKHARSEIFEVRPRDWARAPLADWIATLNHLRQTRPALLSLGNLQVHRTSDSDVLAFTRSGRDHTLLVAVAFDASWPREVWVDLAGRPQLHRDALSGADAAGDKFAIGGDVGSVRVFDLG